MQVIKARNVNDAYMIGMELLKAEGISESSRAGDVLVMSTPVTTVYEYPCERVLLERNRRANPFFHLMESLWMLAGRNGSGMLNRYVSDFGSRFGEQDGTIHGAYGHRWREAMGYDQLEFIVKKLRADPTTRQCVLQMWDGMHAGPPYVAGVGRYMFGSNDLRGSWKDRPCNTQCFFRIHDGALDMTILCRSNDIVWGAYGANAVHFSMMQEYVAAMVGVRVGRMYQVSNNYHAYTSVFDGLMEREMSFTSCYGLNGVASMPICNEAESWDDDLRAFVDWHEWDGLMVPNYRNVWFWNVATPMVIAHRAWKRGDMSLAIHSIGNVDATDWKIAAQDWIMSSLSYKKHYDDVRTM